MNESHEKLKELFNRIPRRHTADNVKEIYGILDAYEDVLKDMEADSRYEQKRVVGLFEALDPIRTTVKKSNDPKASKKTKDVLLMRGIRCAERHHGRSDAIVNERPVISSY